MVKIGFIFGLLGLLLLANTCAAVEFQVSPDVKYAYPGETVTYVLTVSLTDEELEGNELLPEEDKYLPMTEEFSITDPLDDWVFLFSKESVILTNISTTNTSVLSITVPQDANPGYYKHNVTATGYDKGFKEIGEPTSLNIFVVNTNVNEIPEFPSIALPVAAVLGLVFVFGRRKE
ncbi:MAG: PEF-CTERM sorting domain-containing protein [Euryarchaeota archaeon]|nr:PEF-CTERM sorting domain-containing protein [Euryarchaeota archaeon]